MNNRAMLTAAMLAGLGAMSSATRSDTPYRSAPITDAQRARWRDQRGYPQSGTGIRQGARLERQAARGWIKFETSTPK